MCKQAGSLRQATSRNKLRLGTVSVGWEKEQMEKTEREAVAALFQPDSDHALHAL